jgi:uncharacterized protein YodC (DUF2158 family)
MAETFVTVQLKSGGQKMTVERIEGDEAFCAWSDGKRVHKESFATGALKKYIPPRAFVKVIC